VDDVDALAQRFAEHRPYLEAVAYRMLGSRPDAADAVQEAWLRLARSPAGEVRNLRAWLTTVVGRICLDMLRSRATRREEPLDVRVPDPMVTFEGDDPEREAVLADAVGLALLVVLDTLTPAERLAFVLHDLFAVPFTEVGSIMGRSAAAAKQLASRARRCLRDAPVSDGDPTRQRRVVNAFLAAAREGDFGALLAVLDPDVVLRADTGGAGFGPSRVIRGAPAVVEQAMAFTHLARFAVPAMVNGHPGLVAVPHGRVVAVLDATVRQGRIVELNILADRERLRHLDRERPAKRTSARR
jgi:RNA polymerase sigma factor (sigma-70 family)